MQLTFYVHPANERREERGEPAVNSFWLSGCGRAQEIDAAATPQIVSSLRAPLLAVDWAAWAEAWQALDTGPVATLLDRRETARLTLCGERAALRLERRPRRFLERLTPALAQRRGARAPGSALRRRCRAKPT